MMSILNKLRTDDRGAFDDTLTSVVDRQAAEHSLGSFRVTTDWIAHRQHIQGLLDNGHPDAIRSLTRLFEVLELYSPALKGLQDVHTFACESLEKLTFGDDEGAHVAAYLYGQTLGMSPHTHDAISLTVENLLLGSFHRTVICLILGVKQTNDHVYKQHLNTLLRQIIATALTVSDTSITQDGLQAAMKLYNGSNNGRSRLVLESVHELFSISLKHCSAGRAGGLFWVCFLIGNTPMLLRNSLRAIYAVDAGEVFLVLEKHFHTSDPSEIRLLCMALPVLATWQTSRFCFEGQVDKIVEFLLSVPAGRLSFDGLGQLANVILDRFAPYLDQVAELAMQNIEGLTSDAQALLSRLLAGLGPIMLKTMSRYLQCPTAVLLHDVRLLEMSSSLLPNLSHRIIGGLCDVVDEAMSGNEGVLDPILAALTVFPLSDERLARKAQSLVLWTLDEAKPQGAILYALQLAVDPYIATPSRIRDLTGRAAQLLLDDDPQIVHMALSTLSIPTLASVLDEKSCQMILLALHQSLEPSVQIVAAKLLTHLATAHRGIVQPLAWNHIRQSLGLMEFLRSLDPSRAIIEACIISNLLPALPPSVRKRYVIAVRDLILVGLEQPQEGPILSLIFQGLANLAKFDTWSTAQQTQLAIDLLEMSQEIPRDSQHAALNAIARLLAVPQGDAYEMLCTVHATFKRTGKLDPDLKALISGIYGSLGTVERNPVISRDSKAAISRERAIYGNQNQDTKIAEYSDRDMDVDCQVARALQSALAQSKGDDRAAVLQAMTSLCIAQPKRSTYLMPELPSLLIKHVADEVSKSSVLFLGAALQSSEQWLDQHWEATAGLMSDCMRQDPMAVFQTIDIILDSL